jgi:hypothetical protein
MLQARLGVQIEDYRILADLKTWTDPTEGRPD